jgi:hypothetical protein
VNNNSMLFKKFQDSCNKYGFSFTLNSCTYGLKLELEPNFTLQTIVLNEDSQNYRRLFKRAIESMKEYYNNHNT